jgi:nitrilase
MTDTTTRFTVAAVQATPMFLDRDGCVEKASRLIAEAGERGAKLVVLPETWIPGYPFWTNAVSAWNHPGAQQAYARLYRNAVDVPGPVTEALGQAAKQADAYVVVGVHERVPTGTLYNTLVFLGPDGSLLGKRRKLVPTYHERMVWGMGDGSTLQLFDTKLGKLSGLVCWEHWMPLARYALEAQGTQVFASVWPSASETFLLAARHLAHEARAFVVVSASVMTKADLPKDFPLHKEMAGMPDRLAYGGSAVIGPDGKFLAGPVYEREEIVTAEVDLDRILEGKLTLDVAGHYARPDVFKLLVDRSVREAVGDAALGRLAVEDIGTTGENDVGATGQSPLRDARRASPLYDGGAPGEVWAVHESLLPEGTQRAEAQATPPSTERLREELARLVALADVTPPEELRETLKWIAMSYGISLSEVNTEPPFG